jgi:hypothetical protein
MKIKTSELQGAALDWAVASCWKSLMKSPDGFYIATFGPLFSKGYRYPCWRGKKFTPSTDWSQGGPIIEREEVCIWKSSEPEKGKWASAGPQWMELDVESAEFEALPDPWHGPTPLIAAMRCYVASEIGDEVEIPDELLK